LYYTQMEPSFENRDLLVHFLLAVGSFRSKLTAKNGGWKKEKKTKQLGSIGNPYTPELPDSLLGRDVNYRRFYAHSHR